MIASAIAQVASSGALNCTYSVDASGESLNTETDDFGTVLLQKVRFMQGDISGVSQRYNVKYYAMDVDVILCCDELHIILSYECDAKDMSVCL